MFRNPQHWWLDCHIRSKCVTHKWNTEAENPSKILPTISGWSDTLFTVLTEFQTKSQHFNESVNAGTSLLSQELPGSQKLPGMSTVLPRRAASGHWGWKRCNYYYETGRRGAPKYCRGQDRKKKIELPGLDKNLYVNLPITVHSYYNNQIHYLCFVSMQTLTHTQYNRILAIWNRNWVRENFAGNNVGSLIICFTWETVKSCDLGSKLFGFDPIMMKGWQN